MSWLDRDTAVRIWPVARGSSDTTAPTKPCAPGSSPGRVRSRPLASQLLRSTAMLASARTLAALTIICAFAAPGFAQPAGPPPPPPAQPPPPPAAPGTVVIVPPDTQVVVGGQVYGPP